MEPNKNSIFKVRRTKKLLFFMTDINEKDPDNSFLYMARTAQKLGKQVEIITSGCESKIFEEDLKDITVHKVGQYIPKHIYGWGYIIMYLIRILYMLFKLVTMKADFVVVHNSIGLLPLLKLIGHTIIHMYTFNKNELLTAVLKGPEKSNFICSFFMRLADEIVVIDKLSRLILINTFFLAPKVPRVLYPCLYGTAYEKSRIIPIETIMNYAPDDILLVCFGPMCESSNFELCIEAFALFLHKARVSNWYLYQNTYLVIASQYQRTEEYDNYYNKLKQLSLTVCGFRPAVIFLHDSSPKCRKTLISRCEAVLFPMICVDARPLLEAGVMKKPVIAVNIGVSREMIREGTNGFMPPPDSIEFAKCLVTVVFNRHFRCGFSQRIFSFSHLNFGMHRYIQDLNDIVLRKSPFK